MFVITEGKVESRVEPQGTVRAAVDVKAEQKSRKQSWREKSYTEPNPWVLASLRARLERQTRPVCDLYKVLGSLKKRLDDSSFPTKRRHIASLYSAVQARSL